MTACTSFLAFFAEQTLAFAEKMHSRPDRWPQIVRFASGRADSLANQRFVNDQRRAKPFRASIVPGGVYGGGLRALPQFAMVVPRRAQSALAALPCSLGLLRAASRTARALRAPLWSIPPARLRRATSLWSQREAQSIDKVSEERGSNQK